jgi:purine-binding chemotaxis protein CheW
MAEKMGIGAMVDLEKFVDTRFAEIACKEPAVRKNEDREVIEVSASADNARPEAGMALAPKPAVLGAPALKSMVAATREGKYLVFKVGAERYGLPIMDVREIIGMMPITPMIKAPAYVKGMINLRGNVIPVMDLRLKFNITQLEYNERTCIIVVEIAAVGGSQPMGIVVDAVQEVSDIPEKAIQDTPEFGTSFDTSYITGIAKLPGGVAILLDIEHVLTAAA